MSFDTNQKKRLQEAAARLIIIRDQLLNENLTHVSNNNQAEELVAKSIATFFLLNICSLISNIIHFNYFMQQNLVQSSLLYSATQSHNKDEPFTRYKLKIV